MRTNTVNRRGLVIAVLVLLSWALVWSILDHGSTALAAIGDTFLPKNSGFVLDTSPTTSKPQPIGIPHWVPQWALEE